MSTKLLSWVNSLYISEKQIGIQTAHAMNRMQTKLSSNEFYQKWSLEDETIVLLKGHNHQFLQQLVEVISVFNRCSTQKLPTGSFREIGLNMSLTSVVMIVPDLWRKEATDIGDCTFDDILESMQSIKSLEDAHKEVPGYAKKALFDLFISWTNTCHTA